MNDVYKPRVEAVKWLRTNFNRSFSWFFSDMKFPLDLLHENARSLELVSALLAKGAVEVEVDCPLDDESLVWDTIFITVPDPLSKALLIAMVDLSPDEFDEIEPNVFRLWWD